MFTRTTHHRNYVGRAIWLIGAGLLCLCLSAILLPGAARAQAPATMLWGYVMNYKGEFVPGATVTLYTLPAHVAAGPVATSDAQGAWSMDSGSGTFAVRATAPGYDFAEQTVYATATQTGITFILRELEATSSEPLVATMSGRVTSQDGVPLGGMNIVANHGVDTGVRQVQQATALNAAVTGADGTYSLAVPAGEVWLKVQSGSAWGYQLNPVNISAGDNITGADFVVAVRVLARSDFPSPTAIPLATAAPTPNSNVSAGIAVGMPSTGRGSANDLWLALAAFSLLATGAGLLFLRAARPVKQ